MRIVLASLAVGFGLALVGPALAEDPVATGQPVQLAQQPAQQKARQAKTDAKKDVQSKSHAAEAGAKAKAKDVAKAKTP
jgi:hypothetical protein